MISKFSCYSIQSLNKEIQKNSNLYNINQLEDDYVLALPNDIANALNHLSGVLNTTVSFIAETISGSSLESKLILGKLFDIIH